MSSLELAKTHNFIKGLRCYKQPKNLNFPLEIKTIIEILFNVTPAYEGADTTIIM